MESKATDRWIVPALLASLLVWLTCLVVLWSAALDASTTTTSLAVVALAAATGITALLPGRLARGVQWLLSRMASQPRPGDGLGDVAAVEDSGELRARSRLPVVGAGVAFTGCVLSALLVYQGSGVGQWFLDRHVPSPWAWAAVKFVIILVGMIPASLGVSIVLLTLVITRSDRGQHALQRELRDVLFATAVAVFVIAGALLLGVNLLGLTVIAAVAAIASGVGLWLRPIPPGPLRSARGPLEIPTAWQRVAVLVTFAVGGLGLAVQMRVLADAVGADLAGQSVWLGASLAMLGWFLARRDVRSRPPSRTRAAGCVIGGVSGLLLQLALMGAGLGAAVGGWALWLLAAAGQVPVAAMSATVLCRVRRVFGASGGRPREFIALAGLGLAGGTLGQMVLAVSPAGALVALGVALVVLVGAVLLYIREATEVRVQLVWAGGGTLLICLVTLAVLLGVRGVNRRLGRVRAGGWLTVSEPKAAALPILRTPRSDAVDAALSEVLSTVRGRWMHASPSGGLPADGDSNARAIWRTWPADPAAVGRSGWDLPARLIATREHFDGVLYEPLPADHPSAWRAYCLRTMKPLARIARAGRVLLRARARSGGAAAALATAVTYRHAIGEAWVVLDLRGGSVDMLIVGPLSRVTRPADREDARVLKLSELVDALGPLRPIRVFRPGGWAWMSLDVDRLRRTLDLRAAPERPGLPF